MDRQTIVGILNELLTLEQRNLVTRLLESTVFVSRLSVEDLNTVRRMARAGEEHGAWLADAVLQLGGVPGPRGIDPTSADLHYQELHHVLPRIVADREVIIRKYTMAARRLDDEPQAAQLVARILERHRDELTSLQQLGGHNVSAAS